MEPPHRGGANGFWSDASLPTLASRRDVPRPAAPVGGGHVARPATAATDPAADSAPDTLISTPDRRLRVFISSTMEELAAERRAVRDSITRLRLTPVLFELGARPHPPRDLYRAYLTQSDVFVGIYGERYGWVAPSMDISGLEDEFDLSAGMPRLMYVRRDAPNREPRLSALIRRIWRE